MSLVVDSSVWIELLSQGKKSEACRSLIESNKEILVPTVVLFEVYRKICRSIGEPEGLLAVSFLQKNRIVELSTEIALSAADLSIKHGMGLADSIVLAHAFQSQSTLVTLDNDFRNFDLVKIL